MKKDRIFMFALAILLLTSSIAMWNNVSRNKDQKHMKEVMINDTYFKLNRISSNLNRILKEIDTQTTEYTTNGKELIFLAYNFMELHTTLKYYAMSFPLNGNFRSSYTGTIDFEHIAHTLAYGTGTVNTSSYSAILEDGFISENEMKYLITLKNDIDVMIESMTSSENPLQENIDLTTTQLDYILNLFFDKWSYHTENSPYLLLS